MKYGENYCRACGNWFNELGECDTCTKAKPANETLESVIETHVRMFDCDMGGQMSEHEMAVLGRVLRRAIEAAYPVLSKDSKRMKALALMCGIEQCEPDAGQDPSKTYWWNGHSQHESLEEAIDAAVLRKKKP